MKRYRRKKNSNLIKLILVFTLVLMPMSVGYSIFSEVLTISGFASFKSQAQTSSMSLEYPKSSGDIVLKNGSEIREKMITLAGNENNIKGFIHSSNKPENIDPGVCKSLNDDENNSYMWFENENIYWWSENTPFANENCDKMFYGFKNLENVSGITGIDFSKVTSAKEMFFNCSNLKSLSGLKYMNVANILNMEKMFYGLENLNDPTDIENWNLNENANFNEMFNNTSVVPKFNNLTGIWDANNSYIIREEIIEETNEN